MNRKVRILMAKPGLDGHDRGIKVLAAAYRDAGMEVIYLGLRQTPEMIVSSALQEDVDVIALSSLNNAHMTIFPNVLKLMKEKRLDDILLVGGGIIPKKDIEELENLGRIILSFAPIIECGDLLNTIGSLGVSEFVSSA